MSQENVDLVTAGYDDFNSGNIEGVIGRFSDDIEWIEQGRGNAPSGTFRGPDAVRDNIFARVPEQFDEFSCTVENAEDQGDTVVVNARFKGRSKSSNELDLPAEQTFEVRDGKIVRQENKLDQDAWAQAWS